MASTWSDASSWNSFQVLAGCTSSAVHLWDPWTPSSTTARAGGGANAGPRRTICWSTNGKVLAYGGRMDHIVLMTGWETTLGQFPLPKAARGQLNATVNCLRFTADSKLLLAGSDKGTLYAINCNRQESTWQATKHRSMITALATSPDNDTIAAASADQVLLLSAEAEHRAAAERRPGGESAIALPIGACEEVAALAFSRPEDRTAVRSVLLAGVGGNGTVMVWRPADRAIAAAFPNLHSAPATGVSFASEGSQLLYTCGMDRRLLTIDLRTPRQAAMKTAVQAPLTCLSLRPRSNNLGAGTASGGMMVFDVRQMGTVLDEHTTGAEPVLDVAWQPCRGSSSRSGSVAPTPKQNPTPKPSQQPTTPPLVTNQLSPTQSLGSPSMTPGPTGSESPLMMDISPAPAGITPGPSRRPAPEGLLGDSINIGSFADLAEASAPPASGPAPAPSQRRLTDGAAPLRQPDPSATAPAPSSTARTQAGQAISRTTSAAPTTGSRLISHNSAGASTASAAAAAAAAASRSARPGSSSGLQSQQSMQVNSPAKGRSGTLSRYGSSVSGAGPSGSTKLYSALSQIPTSMAGGGADSPASSHGEDLQRAASMVPYSLAPPSVAGDAPMMQQQHAVASAGGKYITEQVFHAYNQAMEERVQESLQSIHLDMMRSFHMLQSEMQQLAAALASRQNDIEDRVMHTQALLERLLQRTQPSAAWQ